MNKWSKTDIEVLSNRYEIDGAKALSDMLGRSVDAITLKANRLGLNRKRHMQDDSFFDTIDTPEKAYWLGFIAADGYVVFNKSERSYELGIELASRDEDHLKLFLRSIRSNANINRRSRRNFINDGYDKSYCMSGVRIYSKHLASSLIEHGIVQNKTNVLSLPIIDDKSLYRHFIRGFFDGDGSFTIHKIYSSSGRLHEYAHISFICKSKKFLTGIQNVLSQNSIVSMIYIDRTSNAYILQIRRSDDARKFFNYLYCQDCNSFLRRKYIKFFNYYNELPA